MCAARLHADSQNADSRNADERVARYRRLRALARAGAAQGRGLLDRYAQALLRRAETPRGVSATVVQRLERLCDLNEAGLLDYAGRGPDGVRFTLSRAGRAVLALAGPMAPHRRALS